jgi:soluble lytic murein transglycosylase-like protein
MSRAGCAVLLGLLAAAAVQAQVYTGLSDSGSVVLSSSQDEAAPTLLLEAERLPQPLGSDAAAGLAQWPLTVPAGYLPFIQEASLAYQLPSELIHAVILVESNYNPRARSAKGAQGLMQLMPATARRFGNANSWDPRLNILTGSKYLRWLLDYFDQDLELSIAAYNAGEAAVVQAGRKVPRYPETERYVPRVMSIYRQSKRLT